MSKALKNAATGIIAISLVAVMFALPTFIFGAMAIMGFTHGGWDGILLGTLFATLIPGAAWLIYDVMFGRGY